MNDAIPRPRGQRSGFDPRSLGMGIAVLGGCFEKRDGVPGYLECFVSGSGRAWKCLKKAE